MGVILVVDDNPEFLKQIVPLLRMGFDRGGTTVESSDSPQEALERIHKSVWSYDVVLTDMHFVNNPHDGLWLMERILAIRQERGYDPAPAVMGFTGTDRYKNEDAFRRAEELGGMFVPKDDPKWYLSAVRKTLSDFHAQRKGPHLVFHHQGCPGALEQTASMHGTLRCSPPGRLVEAWISHESDSTACIIDTNIRSLLLLDLLAHRQQAMSLEDMNRFFVGNAFYRAQAKEDLPYKSPYKSVLMNLNRVRSALELALKERYDINRVLVTELFDYADGAPIRDPEVLAILHSRNKGTQYPMSERNIRIPKSFARYRLQARRSVRH